MNRILLQTVMASTLLLAATTASAAGAGPALPTLTADGLLIDCSAPVQPTQRQVSELTEQANFSQVYATRARLMSDVRRACQREGIAQVIVQRAWRRDKPELAMRWIAR